MLLQETNRAVTVRATAKNDEFTYNVNYSIESGKLIRIDCGVVETVKESIDVPGGSPQYSEREMYLGNIVNELGNVQVFLKEGTDIVAHLETFELILSEVKDQLEKQ